VTGRRANQLRYGALRCREAFLLRDPGAAVLHPTPPGRL
jgi:hypothetical protein